MTTARKYEKLFLFTIIVLFIEVFVSKTIVVAQNEKESVKNVEIATEDKQNDLASLFSIYKQIVDESRGKVSSKNKESKNTSQSPSSAQNDLIKNLMADAKSKGDLEPTYLNRMLQALEDLSVHGDKSIQKSVPKAFIDVGARFLEIDPFVWTKKENMYALMCYTLNGGSPNVFNTIIRQEGNAKIPSVLIDGVTAYIQKDKDKFLASFANQANYENTPLDFQTIINLHISNYYKYTNAKKAILYLNLARTVAKSSFFEEAAIRNEMYLAAKTKNLALLKILTRTYLENFAKSPYLSKFWHEYISSIALLKDTLNIADIGGLMLNVPLPIQNFIYLNISREKLLVGNLNEAKDFALKAIAIEDTNDYNTDRALLYYASTLIPTYKAVQAQNILKKINPDKLSSPDKVLLQTSMEILNDMLSEPKKIRQASSNPPVLNTSNKNKEATTDKLSIKNLNKINENIIKSIGSSGEELKAIDDMLKKDDEKYTN